MWIGTRGSALALWQAHHVQRLLQERAGVQAELEIIESSGDLNQVTRLSELGVEGAFTRELEVALLDGRVDLAVHSHKDLPTDAPDGLVVACVPGRGPVRDVLVIRPEAHDPDAPGLPLRRGARVGTGSARRISQLRARRPDLVLEDLRGNVPTRLAKLARTHPGDWHYDAIVLAEAGLVRLELDPSPQLVVPLETSVLLPAPAQGALALQVRARDLTDPAAELPRALARIHCAETAACVAAERTVLAARPGGCNLPLGCRAHLTTDGVELSAVLDVVGRGLVRARALAPDPVAAAHAVLDILTRGDSETPRMASPTPEEHS
ncbi:MAG: hydroxymethylbilane synthase [Candidatus Krumholzibacteriia bacterium]